MRKTDEQILERIAFLKMDERLTYPLATVGANAPLALTQLSLETELHTLERVMGLPLSKIPLPKKKKKKGSMLISLRNCTL